MNSVSLRGTTIYLYLSTQLNHSQIMVSKFSILNARVLVWGICGTRTSSIVAQSINCIFCCTILISDAKQLCEHYCNPVLKSKDASETTSTVDFSNLCLRMTDVAALSLTSLRFKADSGTATVKCRRVARSPGVWLIRPVTRYHKIKTYTGVFFSEESGLKTDAKWRRKWCYCALGDPSKR